MLFMMFSFLIKEVKASSCPNIEGNWDRSNPGHYTVSSGVEYIGKDAFNECLSLSELTIPQSVEVIDTGAIKNCRFLKVLNIGAKKIMPGAVHITPNLKHINIFGSVEKIHDEMICYPLRSGEDRNNPQISSLCEIAINPIFNVSERNTRYLSDKFGALYDKSMNKLIYVPSRARGSFVVPNTVTKISRRCFVNSQLTEIILPDSIQKIDPESFDGDNFIYNKLSNIRRNYFRYLRVPERFIRIFRDKLNPKDYILNSNQIKFEESKVYFHEGCDSPVEYTLRQRNCCLEKLYSPVALLFKPKNCSQEKDIKICGNLEWDHKLNNSVLGDDADEIIKNFCMFTDKVSIYYKSGRNLKYKDILKAQELAVAEKEDIYKRYIYRITSNDSECQIKFKKPSINLIINKEILAGKVHIDSRLMDGEIKSISIPSSMFSGASRYERERLSNIINMFSNVDEINIITEFRCIATCSNQEPYISLHEGSCLPNMSDIVGCISKNRPVHCDKVNILIKEKYPSGKGKLDLTKRNPGISFNISELTQAEKEMNMEDYISSYLVNNYLR